MLQNCNTLDMDFEEYLKETTGLSVRKIAELSGLGTTKLHHQLKGNSSLTLETIRDISLSTGMDFLDLAIKAKLITREHAQQIRAHGNLQKATDEDLIEELHRRLQAGSQAIKNAPTPFTAQNQEDHLQPETYADHKYLADKYGNNPTQKQLRLAARHVKPQDDIEEIYPD